MTSCARYSARPVTWTGTGVRIANAANADASYEITVSPRVERVLVRVGDSEPIAFDRAVTARQPVRIDLNTGTVRNDLPRDEQ